MRLFFSSLWRARSMISHVRFDSPDDNATTANPCRAIGTGKATTLSLALSVMTVSFALRRFRHQGRPARRPLFR